MPSGEDLFWVGVVVLTLLVAWSQIRTRDYDKPAPYFKPKARRVDECTVEVAGNSEYLAHNFHWNEIARAESFERRDDGTMWIHLASGDADALAKAINISEVL